MNPIFFNSSSNNYSPYPNDLHHEDDHLITHQFLSHNSQTYSTPISLPTHLFINSNIHDQHEACDRELQPPQNQHEGDNFGSQTYNDQRIENNNEKSNEFPTWNKSEINNINNDQNQMKWMSSKMRVMLKMKKSDPVNVKFYSSGNREVTKPEDHNPPTSPMEETDNSSNSTSSNNSIPIRVCSDCNTTKTPLWRSGPRGPKSLCNACGIRQRKVRRALAAAAASAAENGTTNVFINQQIIAPLKVTKTQNKYHKKPKNGHVSKYKKGQLPKQITTNTTTTPPPAPSLSPSSSPSPSPSPLMSPTSSSLTRKNCVEDFLVNLIKNLTCYRVFPQDEKEAAILLMALSCGYTHET